MRAWTNITFHCLNLVFSATEVTFSAVGPQRWTHVLVVMGIMGAYIGIAYVVWASRGWYVYEFMDSQMMSPGLTAGYCFGIGGIGVVAFFVVQGIVWIKMKILGGKKVVSSRRDGGSERNVVGGGGVAGEAEKRYVQGTMVKGDNGQWYVRE
jgi:hypothetical protein